MHRHQGAIVHPWQPIAIEPLYKRRARRPAATAPALTNVVAAAPVKADGVAVPGEVTVVLLPVPLVRVKLAQVRRVVLLV